MTPAARRTCLDLTARSGKPPRGGYLGGPQSAHTTDVRRVQQHVQQPLRLLPIARHRCGPCHRPATSSHQTMGHWRAISPGAAGPLTVTGSASIAQLSAVRGPDLSDSQADSASSILVTRSIVESQASKAQDRWCHDPLPRRCVCVPAACPMVRSRGQPSLRAPHPVRHADQSGSLGEQAGPSWRPSSSPHDYPARGHRV